MSSHNATPIRWREDTGWEFRCGDCAQKEEARFWPLTDEFWDKRRGMLRCRACWRDLDRRVSRERHASSEEVRERKRRYSKRYRTENRRVQHLKDADRWARTKADPVAHEKAKEKGRESMRRYRERVRAARQLEAEARAA